MIYYMHKPESAFVNEMHTVLWDFEKQMDRLISATRPDVVWIDKIKRELAF